MSDEALYTLRQLAEQLKLPESTIRYYRDAFLDHIPSVGTGRRRRYPAAALTALRSIAASYAAGRSRAEIISAIHERPGASAAPIKVTSEKTQRTVPMEEVTNLDLLAAILDGEREQRDALWQMAKEIVRLTEVLEGQDKVLNEIADQAGVSVSGQPRLERKAPGMLHNPEPLHSPNSPYSPVLSHPVHSLAHDPEPVTPSPFFTSTPVEPSIVVDEADHATLEETEPLPRSAPSSESDMERLRQELESERALVERLRESKLQLEHRAADAEAALEERSPRRQSVIRRILGGEKA